MWINISSLKYSKTDAVCVTEWNA